MWEERGSLLPSAWRENQEAMGMSASTYLPSQDGDLINFWKKSWESDDDFLFLSLSKILLKSSNNTLKCIRNVICRAFVDVLFKSAWKTHHNNWQQNEKQIFFYNARDWKEWIEKGDNNRRNYKKQLMFVENWYIALNLKRKHEGWTVIDRVNVMLRNSNKAPIEIREDKNEVKAL